MKKYILLLCTILWMGMIFWFSSQEADKSSNVSNSFLDKTVINVYRAFDSNLTKKDESNIQKIWFVPIRKIAHFSVYFVLGILVLLTLKEFNVKNNICYYAILICFLYSVSDEIHQLFVDGRSGEVLDVLLDTTGSVISIVLLWYSYLKNKVKFLNN